MEKEKKYKNKTNKRGKKIFDTPQSRTSSGREHTLRTLNFSN
jgi:hypothetical protein